MRNGRSTRKEARKEAPTRVVSLTLLLLTLALAVSAFAPSVAMALERARMSWDTATDIDLHVYDDAGNHAWYNDVGGIPEATLSPDDVAGFGPEQFTDNQEPSTRRFFYCAHYYGPGESDGPTPQTQVMIEMTDPDPNGVDRTVVATLNLGQWAFLGSSPPGAAFTCPEADRDGDGILDQVDLCPDVPAPGTATGCPPPPPPPPPDRDGDGVVDASDLCPDTAAPGRADGCPLKKASVVPTPTISGGSKSSATVSKNGSFTLKNQVIKCPAGGSACAVSTSVTVKKKATKLGGSSYKLGTGKNGAAKVKLNATGLRLLNRVEVIRATVTIKVKRGAKVTRKKVSARLKSSRRKNRR